LDVLRQAIDAVQRNLIALAIYLVITVGANTLALACVHLLGGPFENPFENPRIAALTVLIYLVLTVIFAVASAIAFARFGKELDKPLWKCAGDWEAFRRFFLVWFALHNLVIAVEIDFIFAATHENAVPPVLTYFGRLAGFVLAVPAGAFLMFPGGIDWHDLGGVFRPLVRQFPHVFMVLLAYGMVVLFLEYTDTRDLPLWIQPALAIVSGYFDCVVFCAIWIICIIDRQSPEEDDLDF